MDPILETAAETTETAAAETTAPETVKPINLAERLALATEKKPEPKNIKIDTSFFGSDDDFEPKAEEEIKTVKEDEKKPDPIKPAGNITEKAKRSSAAVAVGMLDMTMQSILTPIHGWKFKRKFKKDEVTKIEEYIDDSTLDQLEKEEDKQLKRKWDRLFNKYEKKKNAIPLEGKEKQDLENAFFEYFNFKETTLPPEWFVGMAIVNAVGKRAIDLITD